MPQAVQLVQVKGRGLDLPLTVGEGLQLRRREGGKEEEEEEEEGEGEGEDVTSWSIISCLWHLPPSRVESLRSKCIKTATVRCESPGKINIYSSMANEVTGEPPGDSPFYFSR